jgi:hypothetical protein
MFVVGTVIRTYIEKSEPAEWDCAWPVVFEHDSHRSRDVVTDVSSTPWTEADWAVWLASHARAEPPPERPGGLPGRVGRPATSGRPPSALPPRHPHKNTTGCVGDGCGGEHYARGYCRKCYRSFMREHRTQDQVEFDRQDPNHGGNRRRR